MSIKLDGASVLKLVNLVLEFLPKQPSAKKMAKALGKAPGWLGTFLGGAVVLERCAAEGVGIGDPADPEHYLSPAMCKSLSKGDDTLVKAAQKVQDQLA